MDKYLPDGTINIIFELSGVPKYIFDNTSKIEIQECRDIWFSGVLKEYITISAHAEEMMVVVFKPGAGFPLTHKEASIYTNKVTPAEQVFGKSITALHAKLKAHSSPEEKFMEIENWLSGQLRADDFYVNIVRQAVVSIQNASSEISISELANKSGYSQKQFIELFKKYIGVTPKQLHRIVRFNEILSAIEKKENILWAGVAADCGYFDQAHFIKDFQSFSGLNPKEYLKDIGDYPNYFPVK